MMIVDVSLVLNPHWLAVSLNSDGLGIPAFVQAVHNALSFSDNSFFQYVFHGILGLPLPLRFRDSFGALFCSDFVSGFNSGSRSAF